MVIYGGVFELFLKIIQRVIILGIVMRTFSSIVNAVKAIYLGITLLLSGSMLLIGLCLSDFGRIALCICRREGLFCSEELKASKFQASYRSSYEELSHFCRLLAQ